MLKHIRLPYLLVGVVIGIIGFYFIKTDKKIVYKYPIPESCGKTTYKDKNGVCYHYSCEKVDCDKNETNLKPFPLSD